MPSVHIQHHIDQQFQQPTNQTLCNDNGQLCPLCGNQCLVKKQQIVALSRMTGEENYPMRRMKSYKSNRNENKTNQHKCSYNLQK